MSPWHYISKKDEQQVVGLHGEESEDYRVTETRSRIHDTILLRFLGIILRLLRLSEVSGYNVYITNQFQTTFPQGGGGGGKIR